MSAPSQAKLSENTKTVLKVADMVGAMIEFWGFKRNMGRTWCVLYLHEAPMSSDELRKILGVSTGTMSTTLNELQRWNVVLKAWIPGERREYYRAETNIWTMVSRVFRQRELSEIKRSIVLFREARTEFKASIKPDNKTEVLFSDNRVKQLLEMSKIAETLLEAILAGDSVSTSPLAMFNLPKDDPQ